jgi:hypothetical protein
VTPVPALGLALGALRSRPAAVVLVDGRSGSGKSTFAAALAAGSGATLLRLEDVYPGWDGLAAASAAVVGAVLEPHRRGEPGAIREWDWLQDRAGARRSIPAGGPLVLEGCGALTTGSSRFADLRVWVELPEPERKRRALDRDGETSAPHWARWARQERRVIAREHPRALADVVVDGSAFPQRVLSAGTGDVQ